jgi:hypothetical protein
MLGRIIEAIDILKADPSVILMIVPGRCRYL